MSVTARHIDPPPPWDGEAEDDTDRDREEEEEGEDISMPFTKAANQTPTILRTPIARLARALRPYLSAPDRSATSAALEVARNAAAVLAWQCEHGAWELERDVARVMDVVESLLSHRVQHGWIRVHGFDDCLHRGAVAWCRATALPSLNAEERTAA